MLRSNLNSFDIDVRSNSVMQLLMYADGRGNLKRESIIPIIKSCLFYFFERNGVTYLQMSIEKANVANEFEVLKEWTRSESSLYRDVYLVKSDVNMRKYKGHHFLVIDGSLTGPNTTTFIIYGDGSVVFTLSKDTKIFTNYWLFKSICSVILMKNSAEKKNIINYLVYFLSIYSYKIINIIIMEVYMLRETITNFSIAIGTIVPYFRENYEPENWLICDGRDCSNYELSSIMSKTPDLRGKFIRMVGGNAEVFGIAQEDAIRNITGSINVDAYDTNYTIFNQSQTTYPNGCIRTGSRGPNWKTWSIKRSTSNYETYNFIFDASFVVPTANENRPVNIAMIYLIFAGKKKTVIRLIKNLIKSIFNMEVVRYA